MSGPYNHEAAGDGVDLEGRLRVFSLSDILQMLAFAHKTGTLTLAQGWNTRTVNFEQGRITYIAAATRLPTIPELLIKAGKLTARDLETRFTLAERANPALPYLIMSRGLATPADLEACQDQQLEATIYSLFLWRNCRFSFVGGVLNREDGIPVSVNAERLIIEGTRRVDEWIDISPVIPSVLMTFRRNPDGDLALTDALSPTERKLHRLVDGRSDVAALAMASGCTQFDTARALYNLHQRGLVTVIPPDKANIVDLFRYVVESIYMKLGMYGYSREALAFERELNRFAKENGLRTRMSSGRIYPNDLSLPLDSVTLLDYYKLFVAIENNKFAKMFPPNVSQGLLEGLYIHMGDDEQQMMRMYEFYEIEGLLDWRNAANNGSTQPATASPQLYANCVTVDLFSQY